VSLEENKALVRRYLEQITRGAEAAAAAVDELLAPDFVAHVGANRPRTRDEHREALARLGRAFSEARLTIHHLVAEGDLVAVRFTVDVTHTGEFMGHPPTGKQARNMVMDLYRIAGGRIAEVWGLANTLDFLRQLGVPPPAAPPPPR
jgi:steroid delta-isomerase-like uncharacterized protein